MDYMATEPEDIGQDVIFVETDQELQMNQRAEQVELKAQRVLEAFPFFSSPSTEENLVDTHPTVISDSTESPLSTTPTLDLLPAFNETSSPTEMGYGSQHPTAPMSTISTTETYDSPQNISLLPGVYNETDSYNNLNFTFHQSVPESTTGFPESSYEPTHTHNQTFLDTNPTEDTQPSERPKDSQEMQETSLNFNRSQANYNETDRNHTQEESFWEVTLDPMVHVKLEEADVEDPVQTSLSTQASKGEEELVTQSAQTTKSSINETTSLWARLDGSGDISQGMSSIYLNVLSLTKEQASFDILGNKLILILAKR